MTSFLQKLSHLNKLQQHHKLPCTEGSPCEILMAFNLICKLHSSERGATKHLSHQVQGNSHPRFLVLEQAIEELPTDNVTSHNHLY